MAHNDDIHIPVQIQGSKSGLIREKESGRLLIDDGNNVVSNGGDKFQTTKDIEANILLNEMLIELRRIRQHMEVLTEEKIR